MEVHIENYKNIKLLNTNIDEEKINIIYGLSGSGKSSMCNAMIDENPSENVMFGEDTSKMKIELENNDIKENYSLYNEDTYQHLLINESESPDIYKILFSNECNLDLLKEEIKNIFNDINSQRGILFDYVQNVDKMISKINGRKLGKKNNFSSNSLIEKIKMESENDNYHKYALDIKKNGLEYVKWIEKGTEYKYYELGKCPFCTRKLTSARNKKISTILEIKPENYDILMASDDILKNININVPNFCSKREINKLSKDLNDAVKISEFIKKLFINIDSYNYSSLDIGQLRKIIIPDQFEILFPDASKYIEQINENFSAIRRTISNISIKTNKLIKDNLTRLNNVLLLLDIPYRFQKDVYDTVNKKATIKLVSIEEKDKIDRRKSLSFGEKNVVALLMFLCSITDKYIIIDDPSSSFDENKRKIIFDYIYDIHKNETMIILSHDQIYTKYALIGSELQNRNGKIKEKTGKVLHFDNKLGICTTKQITSSDFDSLDSHILNFLNNEQHTYYRKIISLRLYYEIHKKAKKRALIYSYLSGIFHFPTATFEQEFIDFFNKNNCTEEEILKCIEKETKVKLEPYCNNIDRKKELICFTDFEKAIWIREFLRSKRGKKSKSALEKELDDIVHLNTKYFISLNPYKFNNFSSNIYKNINDYIKM